MTVPGDFAILSATVDVGFGLIFILLNIHIGCQNLSQI